MILTRLIPAVVFVAIFVANALYVAACAASAPSGWMDFGISAHVVGPLGLGAYWRGQDYFIGFSYALGATFATWALSRSILFRQGRTVTAGAAAGGVTLVGALMAGGCFLIGCCGSPMLAVYLSLFGAKALGLGKPLMVLVTFVSVSCGYWCLSRRPARGSACVDDCCAAVNARPEFIDLGRSWGDNHAERLISNPSSTALETAANNDTRCSCLPHSFTRCFQNCLAKGLSDRKDNEYGHANCVRSKSSAVRRTQTTSTSDISHRKRLIGHR